MLNQPNENPGKVPASAASLHVLHPRVLVVEDEAIVAMALSWTLNMLGCETVGVAETGLQALEMAATLAPNVVLMDIGIKGACDGIETACRLRGDHGIPVIYTTAFADDETMRRAAVAAPLGYLGKPYTPEQLQACLEAALLKRDK